MQLTERGRYHDGRGLYLEVSATGSRSWMLRNKRLMPARAAQESGANAGWVWSSC